MIREILQTIILSVCLLRIIAQQLDICQLDSVDIGQSNSTIRIRAPLVPGSNIYKANVSCTLTILNTNEHNIVLNIFQLAIEYSPGCVHRDFLSVSYTKNGLIKTKYFCGIMQSKLVMNKSKAIKIMFRSDSIIEWRGFKMHIDLVKELSKTNEWCQKTVVFTTDKIIMEGVKNDSFKRTATCFGNMTSGKNTSILISLTKVNISRNYFSCDEGSIKFIYVDYCINKEIEKIFCGILLTNDISIVAHSDLVRFEIKAPITSQLLIQYKPLSSIESQCQFTTPVKHLMLRSLTEEIVIGTNNNSGFIFDQSNSNIILAMKIETLPGWKITVNFTEINKPPYEIRFVEHFEYDLNLFTIRNMMVHKESVLKSDSFQLTLVINVTQTKNSSLIGLITVSDVTRRINIVNLPMTFDNVKFLITMNEHQRMLQVVNELKLETTNFPVSILKIKRLTLFNNEEQDYSCNQSGIYVYNDRANIFGPYCHRKDFIPLTFKIVRIIYYYFKRNDVYLDHGKHNSTILDLSLEFYACNFTTLSVPNPTTVAQKFYKCLIFYEPVSGTKSNASNCTFLFLSTNKVALFRLYSRTANKYPYSITNIKGDTTVEIIRSKTCSFKMGIVQTTLSNRTFLLRISINTSCDYVPSGWSVHLEQSSRRRLECNMFSQHKGFEKSVIAKEGILTGDVRMFSHYTEQSVIFPVCYWYFKGTERNDMDNEYTMLSLEMEFFSLDCDRYELNIMEKIDSAVHEVILCNNATVDRTIFSRSNKDIYITFTYKTTPGMVRVERERKRDYFLIYYKYINKQVAIGKSRCSDGWWRIDRSCLKFENVSNINWKEAESICSRYNSSLVKIDDLNKSKGLSELALTKWFNNIYSSASVVIFIGLRNKINGDFYRLKWPNNEPMIYHEWFGRSPLKTYSYVSPSLHGIVSQTLPQPSVENNNQQCTAMMMQHPFYWLNWVKIPCDSKITSSSFICEKAIVHYTTSMTQYHMMQMSKINDPNEIRCDESWIVQDNRCFMIMHVDILQTRNFNDICSLKNAKESSMTIDEANNIKKLFTELWPHVRGNLHYKEGVIRDDDSPYDYVLCQRPVVTWFNISRHQKASDHLFWCGGQDQYWISIDNICDSRRDCSLSNDDEKECGEYRKRNVLFECDSVGTKLISWNRFCNFQRDCVINDADELFCKHPNCKDDTEWRCTNGQCIQRMKRCDQVIDCIDCSDEKECISSMCNGFNCSSSVCLPRKYVLDDIVDCPGVLMEDEIVPVPYLTQSIKKETCSKTATDIKSLCGATSNKCMDRNITCIYHRDNMGSRDVCPLMNHLQNCENFQCPGLFQCLKMKYCIQLHYVCDGIKDCPNGEDEDEEACNNLTCPFHFRCRAADMKHFICLERRLLCDGIKDCLNGEDERYCDMEKCPAHCNCSGYHIYCFNTSTTVIATIIRSTRLISIRNTSHIKLNETELSNFPYLGYLSLRYNHITVLPSRVFDGLFNLLILDISFNHIESLPSYIFMNLQRLRQLDLSHNPIQVLEPFSLSGLISLTSINLTSMNYVEIPNHLFSGMSSKLLSVNLSNNDIRIINKLAFDGISNLSSLDITVTKFDIAIIGDPLSHLTVTRVKTNIYKICCSLAKFDSCSADTDISSNCDNLLANPSIQVIAWIIGITGLMGNIGVILWRLSRLRHSKKIFNEELLVINLAFSDMLLGIYLLIIVVADHHYRNQYVENSTFWKSGYVCTIAGYLATVSNQASATFLGLITLDRVICIVLTRWKDYVRIIKYSIIPIWLFWIFSVALFEYKRFILHESFQPNGLCLSYFSLNYESNLKNSFSLTLIVYIFIFLLLIVLGYIVIFIHSYRTRLSAGRMMMLNDYKSAKKMLILVLVFCLCWSPIIILSFITKNGTYKLTNDQLTWLTVVLMPLNSCINPYMYTFSNVELCFKFNNKRLARSKTPTMYALSTLSKK